MSSFDSSAKDATDSFKYHNHYVLIIGVRPLVRLKIALGVRLKAAVGDEALLHFRWFVIHLDVRF